MNSFFYLFNNVNDNDFKGHDVNVLTDFIDVSKIERKNFTQQVRTKNEKTVGITTRNSLFNDFII